MKKYSTEIIVLFAIIIPAILILIYYFNFRKYGISDESANWANFGNYLSGVIGTILTFISIILIYKTYKNQVKNSTLQQFETTFFNLLQNQREILKSLSGYIKTDDHIPSEQYVADEYIYMIASILNQHFDRAPGRFINNEGEETWKLENKQKMSERINTSYNRIYKQKEAELGHYFRHLYHILKYVHESEIPFKKKYIDIIQAQMSDNELYVAFYNGISEYGKKRFLPMLDSYQFFENIRSRGVMFDKHKEIFYPSTAFKYNA